jgi:hypothetical protein
MDKPIAKLKLLTTEGKVVDAILYCHQETRTIAGVSYYLLENMEADASGLTLSASTASVARVVWGKFVYPLTGIAKILASTIYATYRAYTGGGTVNAEIDILIRKADGTVRTTIATGVSKSANLGTSWATYTGANYSFAEYTVVDQTDYFEIDYIANVTAKKASQYAYLRIDDNTLALADQTRSQEWSFASLGLPRVAGQSISDDATWLPFQRKCFYANGLFWAFYSDGTNLVYSTSSDGQTWSPPTAIRPCTNGINFSVWFDGTYLHYAYASLSSIYYRRGTPNSNGSITWSAPEQTVSTTFNKALAPMISVDSGGYVWIGYSDYESIEGFYYPFVIKSGNNDGTWGTTPSGFPYQLSTLGTSLWSVSPIPLTYGKMLIIYAASGLTVKAKAWTGSGWLSEVATASIIASFQDFSAVAQGDDVHLVFCQQTTNNYIYTKYDYASNSFGAETTLVSGAEASYSNPKISIDSTKNNLYVFAATKTTGTPAGWTANHIYYCMYDASTGTWSSWIDWIDESGETLTYADHLTSFYQSYGNYIGLLYMTKTASPYNIKFAFLSVIVPVAETIVAKNFPMDYLASPVKAAQLTSKVSGATITNVSQDYPLTLIKKDKAQELKSKWT